MPLVNCANRMPLRNGLLPLRLEILERRLLLSTSKPDVVLSPTTSETETAVTAQATPILIRSPAIPLDDSIDPVVDCPGLDPRFCLPRETKPRHTELQVERNTKQTDYVFRALIWRTLERTDVDPMAGN
jgi:hypothetical protein